MQLRWPKYCWSNPSGCTVHQFLLSIYITPKNMQLFWLLSGYLQFIWVWRYNCKNKLVVLTTECMVTMVADKHKIQWLWFCWLHETTGRCWKTRNAQEQNRMEPEVIDAQCGRGHQIYTLWKIGVNMSMYRELISPVPATKTRQAPSWQYGATPSLWNILAVYLVSASGIADPSLTNEGSAMWLPSLGSAVGSGVTCGSPWNRKGMVLRSVLSTNTKQASPQSVRFHVNILQARTAVGSAMRFYQCIYSSVH